MGSRLFSKIVISPGQWCIYVMSLLSADVTKQQKIFNDRAQK